MCPGRGLYFLELDPGLETLLEGQLQAGLKPKESLRTREASAIPFRYEGRTQEGRPVAQQKFQCSGGFFTETSLGNVLVAVPT